MAEVHIGGKKFIMSDSDAMQRTMEGILEIQSNGSYGLHPDFPLFDVMSKGVADTMDIGRLPSRKSGVMAFLMAMFVNVQTRQGTVAAIPNAILIAEYCADHGHDVAASLRLAMSLDRPPQ
jgi:hypothetical protein